MFEQEKEDTIDLLKQMISIPSFSKEEKNVADFLEKHIEAKGYYVNRIGNNIWLLSPDFDAKRTTLLLNSHIDTVRPVAGWTYDPFKPIYENGKLFGLGSNDAGASVVALLQTFFFLTTRAQSYNIIFAATAEEEISGANGIESILSELPKIDFAIVGEPTVMNMAVAEKGLMVLDCTVYGEAGHAARDEGENAIYNALPSIEWFRKYQFSKVSDFLGKTTMSVTQINAGTQHNVIPDKCTFVVDVRTSDLYTNEEVLKEIKENVLCEIVARSTRLSSTHTPMEHPLVKRGIELNRLPFGSQTLSDQALMPFPSVKMGPGNSMRSHTADEFIIPEEIYSAVEIYIQLLNGLDI